ncbi:hypothetical protein ADUPG1_000005 [Aduncisulcus paluster]|uniref:Uncharacterized protein n=2 Tax=Aduncisulcus paluster TaxID=2918883 RepID=A0ABQ5K661_9EUKA|nr:hypothetical protein ADUPG1_000005 [Aduncisulcus paluster]
MTEEAQSSIETGEISRLFESLSASNIPNLLTDLGILVTLGSQRKYQVGDINYNIPTKDVALKVLVHIYEKYPLVRELFDGQIEALVVSIKKTYSQSAIKSLYEESHSRLEAVFDEFTSSPSAVLCTSTRDLFALCFECLSLFVKHKVTKKDGTPDEDDIEVILDSSSIKNIIDTFLPSMLRVEDILRDKRGRKEEEEETGETRVNTITMALFRMLNTSTSKDPAQCFTSSPQISSLLTEILILGQFEKLENCFVEDILIVCWNIAFAKDDLIKDSLLSIILPHISPWMTKYSEKRFFYLWMNILKNITNDKDNINPHKNRSSQLWFAFHPVLDIIMDTASKGILFEDDAVICCLFFFSNLSCIPSQAIEVHSCIKDDLLDSWFEMIEKKKKSEKEGAYEVLSWGVNHWSRLISMLSIVPSLVPQLSPKYDANIEWCKKNGGLNPVKRYYFENCHQNYIRYLGNCHPSLKKWVELVETILKCPDSESTSKLYHEHRDDILSVFLAFQSKSKIEEHKMEIVLCAQCLRWVVHHNCVGKNIYLPISDLNNLIDTFIDHLSRVEEVFEDVDEEYCWISYLFSRKVNDKHDSFLPKILSTFRQILERGSKKRLDYKIVIALIYTLRNISVVPSSYNRAYIFSLVKPYLKDWLGIYEGSKYFGMWMDILASITLSSDNLTPNKSICSEAWHFFHPVLDVVKREFVGYRIDRDGHESVFLFFSNLCFDPSHAVEIFYNVKNLLGSWFRVIKRKEDMWGIKLWFRLISTFSTNPSLLSHISPRYDGKMKLFKEKYKCSPQFYDQYISNISSFVSSSFLSSTLLHSVPILSLLPSIETSLCAEKDEYSYASHVCSVMELYKTVSNPNNHVFCYHNMITGKEIQIRQILKRDGLSSHESITHSSLIKYTPPLHMLVQMSFDEERSLRQSVYDLIERTGGGVEIFFDQEPCCSFAKYDQEAWRKGMEKEKATFIITTPSREESSIV